MRWNWLPSVLLLTLVLSLLSQTYLGGWFFDEVGIVYCQALDWKIPMVTMGLEFGPLTQDSMIKGCVS